MNGHPRTNGWVQDFIFAACVGDTEGVARRLVEQAEGFQNDYYFPYLKMEHGTNKAIISYPGHEDVVLNNNPESHTGRR